MTDQAEEELSLEEDVYYYILEMIDPHIKWQSHGMSCCGPDSLTASVTDSFDYLLDFWLKNRDKEGVEHP